MNRRGFLLGLGTSIIAAPAIVRAASLMPVRGIVMPVAMPSDVFRIIHRSIMADARKAFDVYIYMDDLHPRLRFVETVDISPQG